MENETGFHYLIIVFRQLLATNITYDTINWIEGINPSLLIMYEHQCEHPPQIHRMVEIFQNHTKNEYLRQSKKWSRNYIMCRQRIPNIDMKFIFEKKYSKYVKIKKCLLVFLDSTKLKII